MGEDGGKGGLDSSMRCRNKAGLAFHGEKNTAQICTKAVVAQRWHFWGETGRSLPTQ